MKKPILMYDGDCSFCKVWIEYWKKLTGERVSYAPYQQVAEQFPEIPREYFQKSVQLVSETGEVFSGAEAVFRSLGVVPEKRWLLWLYRNIPGIRLITEFCYRFIAQHRNAFYKITWLLWGKHPEPPAYLQARWLFLRLGHKFLDWLEAAEFSPPKIFSHLFTNG